MATFLKLCQDVAAESGTVQGTKPATTTGQTGRLGLIVGWVREAWVEIQNSADWRFLRKNFPDTAALTAGTACYDGLSFALHDFKAWVIADPVSGPTVSLYDPDVGRSDQQDVAATDYSLLDRRFYYGSEADTQSRPLELAINDQNQLCFGPIPDKPYTVRGTYIRAPQELGIDPATGAALADPDADLPIMPAPYHQAIKWKALMLLAEFDEADTLVLHTAERNYRSYSGAMRRDLLRRGGPYIDSDPLGGSFGGRSFGGGGFGPPPTVGFD